MEKQLVSERHVFAMESDVPVFAISTVCTNLVYLNFPAENDIVECLNLSWNHLRLKGAQAIAKALQVRKNTLGVVILISWFLSLKVFRKINDRPCSL